MATLTITKTYEDGTVFFEVDLDAFRDALLDLVNTTKLNNDNISDSGIDASKISITTFDNDQFQKTSTEITLKDSSITSTEISSPLVSYGSVGLIRMHHTYNGAAPIPRGWMTCLGDVINETNYNAIHGAGAYAADGIASSALLNKYLPDFEDAYPVGISSTNYDGTSAIDTTGSNTSAGVSHSHIVVDIVSGGHDKYHNSAGTATNITSSTVSGPGVGEGTLAVDTTADFTHTSNLGTTTNTVYSSTASTTSINIEPQNYEVLFIMRVI